MKKAKDVDEYIASSPENLRGKLKQLRKVINDTVPEAEERISYGMPYYGYKGKLAYFRYTKDHIGLYVPPPVIEDHKKELKDYGTSTATVRFPIDKKIPIGLVKKLIKARAEINDSIQASH